ncbi:class I SAM-dependent methyltransferase [Halomonas sp. C22]|uniref:class I SAM-dependent methyltransferase n=1 Tax=Halomonas sp. C22 TaxID=2580567 RepID=UPI0011A2C9C2|nr:class I SAM-dependent methyltransferase [Halomonas sp. C22]
MDFEKSFHEECNKAPRLNEMYDFFSDTAAGFSGMPKCKPMIKFDLIEENEDLIKFSKLHQQFWGDFDLHYYCSIPFRLEEEVRIGDALLNYSKETNQVLNYYILGAAEGSLARTLGYAANGKIKTLSCSPNIENKINFYSRNYTKNSTFFLGPFHKISQKILKFNYRNFSFYKGFDVLMEDTTFQMYSSNRDGQLGHICKLLKNDGILILNEKFKANTETEYLKREKQKNEDFKSLYFEKEEILKKNETIVGRMYHNEVSIEEIKECLEKHFMYSVITWNSGNFYTIASSNSLKNLSKFISGMSPPCIPIEFSYIKTPFTLIGGAEIKFSFNNFQEKT